MNVEVAVSAMASQTACAWIAARECGRPLSARICFVAVPLATTTMLLLSSRSSDGCALAIGAAIVAAVTDVVTGSIFNYATLAALVEMLATAGWQGHCGSALLGAIATAAPLGMLYAVSRGRAIGGGDVKFSLILGAGLGIAGGLYAIGAAFIAGAACNLVLVALRRTALGSHVRFGPYLAVGAVLAGFAQ